VEIELRVKMGGSERHLLFDLPDKPTAESMDRIKCFEHCEEVRGAYQFTEHDPAYGWALHKVLYWTKKPGASVIMKGIFGTEGSLKWFDILSASDILFVLNQPKKYPKRRGV
jgi:hypothetical protein